MKINWQVLKNLWIISGGIFDKNKVESKIAEFEKNILEEGFWKDKENATKIIKLKKNFENIFNSYKETVKEINNLKDFKIKLQFFIPFLIILCFLISKSKIFNIAKKRYATLT